MNSDATLRQVDSLVAAERFADAARLLIAAAGSGRSAALAELAHWRVAGNLVRRDLRAARDLLRRAGGAGDRDSALLHAAFLASGAGGGEDWPGALAALRALAPDEPRAAAQLALLEAMELRDDGSPVRRYELRRLSAAPEAFAAEEFVSAAECRYLQKAVEPVMQPTVVVDPSTGAFIPHPIRRSEGAVFGVYAEDLVVNALNRRIAALSGTRADQGEPLQLLRYRPGCEYKPHMDALPAEPNQRILTVLVYISDDYEGGETQFPHTGLSFRGRTGDALLFRNAAADGRPDPLSLHAGLPVTRGTKYLASRWIRAAKFTYPPPRPILDL
jgi:prolyl 4-hydroxylase